MASLGALRRGDASEDAPFVVAVTRTSALPCLARLGSDFGLGLDSGSLDAVTAPGGGLLPLHRLVELAAEHGIELRPVRLDWRGLQKAALTDAALLVLHNSNVVAVLGFAAGKAEEILLSDPLYKDGASFTVPRAGLEEIWGGDALIAGPLPPEAAALNQPGAANPFQKIIAQSWVDVAPPKSDGAPPPAAEHPELPSRRPSRASHAALVVVAGLVIATVVGAVIAFMLLASTADVSAVPTTPLAVADAPVPAAEATSPGEPPQAAAESLPPAADGAAVETAPPSTFVEAAPAPEPAVAAASADASAPVPTLSPEEAGWLLARGDALFGSGDVTSARLFYRRAADAGDPTAALRLGASYDPAFLARGHWRLVAGDADQAIYWYSRARDLGNREAVVLLQIMQGDPAKPRMPR